MVVLTKRCNRNKVGQVAQNIGIQTHFSKPWLFGNLKFIAAGQ